MLAVKKSLGDFELNVNNVSRILQELDYKIFLISLPQFEEYRLIKPLFFN